MVFDDAFCFINHGVCPLVFVAVVATSDPFKSGIPIDTIIDAPSAVIVPAEKLPLLTPAVILPLED